MSVNISGLSELIKNLERRYGEEAVTRISDQALIDASQVFKVALIAQLATFKDTGATLDELTFTEPYTKDGVRIITVHWKGPKGRYRVIHLNEYGTVSNPNPRGKGSIGRAVQISEVSYARAIRNAIERGL